MKRICSLVLVFALLLNLHIHAGHPFTHYVGVFPHSVPFSCLKTYGNTSDTCVQDCRCGFCNSTSSCLNGQDHNCTKDQWNYTDECVQREEQNRAKNEHAGKTTVIIFCVSAATAFLVVTGVYLYPRCKSCLRQRDYIQIDAHSSTAL